ncbi:M1 family metallopeptidase [Flavicella marina]|uniref:M1 family metallopeptidase n=1 Tax=Flavicella marina TaxID=1475951 RepID=UPI001263F234|nr:M1 family metallopeptidase [Flavicella marina]
MKKIAILIVFLNSITFHSQKLNFTQQDSLRGSITENRIWWDLQKYSLSIDVLIENKFISGTNKITYKVLETSSNLLQIELQSPMKLMKATQDQKDLSFKKNGNIYLIELQKEQVIDATEELIIDFEGRPKTTDKAPWEGGFTWTKDSNEIDFVATSCQGDGASLWWPCKDHPYDEPDNGVELFYTVPKDLVAVGNGKLIDIALDTIKKTKTYHWKVINPINNYAVSLSIGNYVSYQKNYKGKAGVLDCDYYCLKQNFPKAKKQFLQVEKMLDAFEFWFGPYPFYEDSYKIVEVPFLGMEHQSAVAYGNQYKNGYLGTDLSGTGWGLKFDFIIIHESGHEWFGNNITHKDIADMWIHESFTNYSEALYLEQEFGAIAGKEYIIGLRKNIKNDKPIIGQYNVNNRGSDDMYYKGANMLHTMRHVIGNDGTWRLMLIGINQSFYHKTVSSKELEKYICDYSGIDFSKVFDQYLRTTQIPVFEYEIKRKTLKYRWTNCIENFDMPMFAYLNKRQIRLTPSTSWKKLKLPHKITDFVVDDNLYIESKEVD